MGQPVLHQPHLAHVILILLASKQRSRKDWLRIFQLRLDLSKAFRSGPVTFQYLQAIGTLLN